MARSRRGAISGLDALIMLVAILLVVSVVAALLLSTQQSLVRREQSVYKEKSKGLQKPIIVEQVRMIDTDGDKRFGQMAIIVRMQEASNPIHFNETIIFVNSRAINCTKITYGNDATENCDYTLEYPKKGPDWEQDHLNVGDTAELLFSGPYALKNVEDLTARLTFVPEDGVTTEIIFEMPPRVHPANMPVWPLKG